MNFKNVNITFDLETLKKRLSGAAGYAQKKATALTALAKANSAIYAEEGKIKKAEAELGRLYYNDFIAGCEADSEAYEAVCNRITESKVLIEGLKAEIAELKAKDKAEAAVEEDEITDEDFVITEEEAPAEAAPAEEAPAEAAPAEEATAEEALAEEEPKAE